MQVQILGVYYDVVQVTFFFKNEISVTYRKDGGEYGHIQLTHLEFLEQCSQNFTVED